jgi:5-methylcytosine-specific restriction endonuclease McrA
MLPFEKYDKGGRELLGTPKTGDGTCRHGYGLPVFKQCGLGCSYCERPMDSPYEAWLDISVDHVVPRSMIKRGFPREWVEDISNLATCCRACNEFLNQYAVNTPPPAQLDEFHALRDRVFLEKKAHAQKRHHEERAWYEKWRMGETR